MVEDSKHWSRHKHLFSMALAGTVGFLHGILPKTTHWKRLETC
jgi:hypothetical protein